MMPTSLETAALSRENFKFIRSLMESTAAIVIDPGKEYLVETRLASVAIRHGFGNVNGLIDHLRRDPDAGVCSSTVDALTTNETLFFRDLNPFEALRDSVIPEFFRRNPTGTFRVWSAACSSGQEPYSIAMLAAEHFPHHRIEIVATDLSQAVLDRAVAGRFSQLEVNRGLPARLLVRHFRQVGDQWELDPQLRARVQFRRLNLMHSWDAVPGPFDVVLLRNVMIYFDVATRRRILDRVAGVLRPEGYLVLGGAETTVTIAPEFNPVPVGRATFFQI